MAKYCHRLLLLKLFSLPDIIKFSFKRLKKNLCTYRIASCRIPRSFETTIKRFPYDTIFTPNTSYQKWNILFASYSESSRRCLIETIPKNHTFYNPNSHLPTQLIVTVSIIATILFTQIYIRHNIQHENIMVYVSSDQHYTP